MPKVDTSCPSDLKYLLHGLFHFIAWVVFGIWHKLLIIVTSYFTDVFIVEFLLVSAHTLDNLHKSLFWFIEIPVPISTHTTDPRCYVDLMMVR